MYTMHNISEYISDLFLDLYAGPEEMYLGPQSVFSRIPFTALPTIYWPTGELKAHARYNSQIYREPEIKRRLCPADIFSLSPNSLLPYLDVSLKEAETHSRR